MAWQRYIDPPTGLLATGHVEMGAIYGHDGALWAASTGMERVRYHELLELKNIFNNPKKGFSRGFSVGEEQYTLLTVDEDVLYGKGKEGCSRFIVVRKSKRAFIVGIGREEGPTSSQVSESVFRVYDFMLKNDF